MYWVKGSVRGFISVEDLDEDAIYLLADHALVALGAVAAVAFVAHNTTPVIWED